MKIMNWLNLREMLCPYCDNTLTKDLEIRCTECLFHIEEAKFKSIVAHRGLPERDDRPKVNMYWQNLRDDRCPMDAHFLKRGEGKYEMLVCSNQECTFKIREDTMNGMLSNPNHAANKFYKPHDNRPQ